MNAAVISIVVGALAGTVISSLLSCIPGLHVYALLGAVFVGARTLAHSGLDIPAEGLIAFTAGMIVAFSIAGTIPAVLLAAPDESAVFAVKPGQKYLMHGRGYEGIVLTVEGAVGALLILLSVAPFAPRILPVAQTVIDPHLHWILWCLIAFMLLSEQPQPIQFGLARRNRLLAYWRRAGIGLVIFLLSGLLGFMILYRPPITPLAFFPNLMPAFVGLFTLPPLLLNILEKTPIPRQRRAVETSHADMPSALRSLFIGAAGGGVAAFFPVGSGGVGGFLTKGMIAACDDHARLVSQNSARAMYYVGSLLLFFMPGLHLARGEAAALPGTFLTPGSRADYYALLGGIAISAAAATLLMPVLVRFVMTAIVRLGYRSASMIALLPGIGVVLLFAGWRGVFLMIVSTAIGVMPLIFDVQRAACFGVVLLPTACNLSGFGMDIVRWLGWL